MYTHAHIVHVNVCASYASRTDMHGHTCMVIALFVKFAVCSFAYTYVQRLKIAMRQPPLWPRRRLRLAGIERETIELHKAYIQQMRLLTREEGNIKPKEPRALKAPLKSPPNRMEPISLNPKTTQKNPIQEIRPQTTKMHQNPKPYTLNPKPTPRAQQKALQL